jgi:glycosyltransferase involved in cell wall biosynthesis
VIYVNGLPTGRWNTINLLKHSKGKYIALCEGDDYWTDPLKLQKQVDFLDAHPDFVMCSHSVDTIFEGVEEINPFVEPLKVASFDDIAPRGVFIPTLSIVFRASALPEMPDWFRRVLSGDEALILLLTHYGPNYYMDEVMGLKRKHPGGLTQQPQRKKNKVKKIKCRIYFYEQLNRYFNYEHKSVLNPKIASLYIHLGNLLFMNRNLFKFCNCILLALHHSPSTILHLLLRRLVNEVRN